MAWRPPPRWLGDHRRYQPYYRHGDYPIMQPQPQLNRQQLRQRQQQEGISDFSEHPMMQPHPQVNRQQQQQYQQQEQKEKEENSCKFMSWSEIELLHPGSSIYITRKKKKRKIDDVKK